MQHFHFRCKIQFELPVFTGTYWRQIQIKFFSERSAAAATSPAKGPAPLSQPDPRRPPAAAPAGAARHPRRLRQTGPEVREENGGKFE